MFSIQYNKITGKITGTCNTVPPSVFTGNIGQIISSQIVDITNMMVDVNTLQLIPAMVIATPESTPEPSTFALS